jgi:hypothetical protein
MESDPTLLVVDAANVVGSVPDGWWRDRAGAATRLRDALRPVAATGLPDCPPPLEVVLVVEGAARGVTAVPGVRVLAAPGSGDDAIVDLLRAEGGGRASAVVTADRGLRGRVTALGAAVFGPSALPRWSAGRSKPVKRAERASDAAGDAARRRVSADAGGVVDEQPAEKTVP